MIQPNEVTIRLARHECFWGERFEGEGAYIAVTAPDNRVLENKIQHPLTLKEQWLNVEYRLAKHRQDLETTYYAGDAVPTVFSDFGPGVLAALLGVEPRFAEHTIWFDSKPIIQDWNDFFDLKINFNCEIYQAMSKLTRILCEEAKGQYIVGIPDIGVNLDVLVSLRGTESLLRDMITKKDIVSLALKRIDEFWLEVFEESVGTIKQYMQAVSSWVPIAGTKSWYPLLSEFSSMISPSIYEKITLPALQREADNLEKVLFNLDGESQIKFLPMALHIKGLHSVMWDPVPKLYKEGDYFRKEFSAKESLEIYEKIQAANKKIIINGIKPDQVKPILDNISPDGVFLYVNCENPKEADEFLSFANKWIR